MTQTGHSDWTFEHSAIHHDDGSANSNLFWSAADSAPMSEAAAAASSGAAAAFIKSLWEQGDAVHGSSVASAVTPHPAAAVLAALPPTPAVPTLTIAHDALTVTEGGSIPLPINVTSHAGETVSVTIKGLASYETLTDHLDDKIFTGSSVTLSAAEVDSGLTLASSFSGPGHPVNTLVVTATDTVGHASVTSAAQDIVVTDPPATTAATTTAATSTNGLVLQVTGDNDQGTDAQIEVFVDGTQAGGVYTVTADHTAGQVQTIDVPGTFSSTAAHQVQIKFINDGWDGKTGDGNDVNVYVESIELNGTTLSGISGTNTAQSGTVPAASNSHEAVMNVDCSLTFTVAAAPAPAPV